MKFSSLVTTPVKFNLKFEEQKLKKMKTLLKSNLILVFDIFDERLAEKRAKRLLLGINACYLMTMLISNAFYLSEILSDSDLLMECSFSMLLIIQVSLVSKKGNFNITSLYDF